MIRATLKLSIIGRPVHLKKFLCELKILTLSDDTFVFKRLFVCPN